MNMFPTTIKEHNEISTQMALILLVQSEKSRCTNIYYSPKYEHLQKLYKWINKNVPDERLH